MSAAVVIALAEKIANSLNAASLGESFTAVRDYAPEFEVPQLNVLRVVVVPASDEAERSNRSTNQHDYTIDVGVMKKPEVADEAELKAALDDLVLFCQRLADHLLPLTLAGLDGDNKTARCLLAIVDPIYSPEHIREYRQFTSVIRSTWRLWR